jgi:putative addiction module component (TIGR02574 family)
MATISLSDLLKLTPAERIQLAQDLWDSIPEDAGSAPLSPEEIAEFDLRLAAHEADPSSGVSYEDVRARLSVRFGA